MFDTPEGAFRTAVTALNAGDWRSVAATCDPASLTAFKRQMLEQFEPSRPRPTLTIEQLTRHDPELPRAVAEYQVAQFETMTDPREQLRDELPSVRDVAELKRLEPAEVFAAWLEGRSPKRMIERLVRQGRFPAASASAHEQLLPALNYDPIGVVHDGERVAHVLYRHTSLVSDDWEEGDAARWLASLSAEEQALAKDLANRQHPSVTTCRRQPDGTWRLIADYGFLTLGSIGLSLDGEVSDSARDEPAERPPEATDRA